MRNNICGLISVALVWLLLARAGLAIDASHSLAADLASTDAAVRERAIRDLVNGEFHGVTEPDRLAAVLPALKIPDLDPHSSQGLLIEFLPRILGSEAKNAIPILLTYIADNKISPYLRGRAMYAAAHIAPRDPRIVTAIVNATAPDSGVESPVMTEALRELGKMGQAAETARPLLRDLLANKNWYVQDGAFEALGLIALDASPDKQFIGALADKDPDVRAAAHAQLRLRAMPVRGPTSKQPRLLGDLTPYRAALQDILENHADDFDRRAALATLAILKPGGDARMVKSLLACMNGQGFSASNAEQAIAQLEPTDPAAVTVLLDALRRNNTQPRGVTTMTAVRALGKYGLGARAALPDLLAGFDQMLAIPRHEFATEEVATYLTTLAAIGPSDPAVIGRILDLAASGHPLNHPLKPYGPVGPLALEALATIGLPAEPILHKRAVACLIDVLAEHSLAASAAAVLEKTDIKLLAPDESVFVPILVKILASPSPAIQDDRAAISEGQTRISALRVLAHMGAGAREAVPVVKELADRPRVLPFYSVRSAWENGVSHEARKTLGAISAP